MNDSVCQAIRPLLFASIEGQIDTDERIRLVAHLAVCDACRSFERAERALTELLECDAPVAAQPRRTSRRILAPLVAAVAIVSMLFIFPAATPRGSLVSRELDTATAWVETKAELSGSNHLSIPRSGSMSIELDGGVELEATGPARFELDFVADAWKLVVLEGRVSVTTTTAGALVVVNRAGRRPLGVGAHTVEIDTVEQDPQDKTKRDAASLIAEGQRLYFSVLPGSKESNKERMAAVEKLFSQALSIASIKPEQRNTALFYLSGAQGRQGKNEEALATGARWLELYPNDRLRSYVLYFQAVRHERLGNSAKSREIHRQVIEEDPDSEIAGHSKLALGIVNSVQPAAAQLAQDPIVVNVEPLRSKPGPYLVVRVGLSADRQADVGFVEVAGEVAQFHRAEIAEWDGRDFNKLATVLAHHRPENVLFVLRPGTLDINLHRQILLRSVALDDDIFVDFAFGYLTAADGASVKRLWQRIRKLHAEGLSSRLWVEASVTTADRNLEYESAQPIALTAGFTGKHYYTSTKVADNEAFVDRVLHGMQSASVIQLTGNGDPQGIWLFDDHRNADRSKHWEYSPEMVGHDPNGEMPRIMASQFAALDLASPIVWSGTCHSGATRRVFVEADIVSTFGRTDVATVHDLAPDRSLALSLLDAGAAALLVPIAANHGMSVSMEAEFALCHGASLGETLKSTYDDVFMAAEGRLLLDIAEEGQPHGRDGWIMQGGGANRILIGDPALRPFRAAPVGSESVMAQKTDGGFAVRVERSGAAFIPNAWDIYGRAHPNDWRILTRVDLGDLVAAEQRTNWAVQIEAEGPGGKKLPFQMRRCYAEDYHGRRYLHIQANGPRAQVERKAVNAVFEAKRKR